MHILGKGLYGVVVLDGDTVQKFYNGKEGWNKEVEALRFLSDIQKQGFTVGCTIPRLFESISGKDWRVQNETYQYRTTMEFIPGLQAAQTFASKDARTLGMSIGETLFNLHTQSKSYIHQWTDQFGDADNLWFHVLTQKSTLIMEREEKAEIRERATQAVRYLNDRKEMLAANRTLSHTDINLKNILVDVDNSVQGLVDWGDLGYTNPSLTMYQLATTPSLWTHIRDRYRELGGTILEDVVYAAAVIHLAWAPLRLAQLELPVGMDDSRERFDEIYARFLKYL